MERRAYKQALFATRDNDVALDAVQDSMLKLTEKYSHKPAAELPLLFQRILQNTIRDYFRRQKVRSLWVVLVSALMPSAEQDNEINLLENISTDENDLNQPLEQLERTKTLAIIEEALQILPARQREAFLLRYWEDMDVAETAAIMGCSEGSVKTHCSRANHALAAALRAKGVE